MYAFTPFGYSNWPGIEIRSGGEVSWCITDISFPTCNVAFQARLKPEITEEVVKGFISRGESRKVPLYWYTTRNSLPSNLGEKLIEQGFIYRGDSPGMAVDILRVMENTSIPPGLEVKEVRDLEALKLWCRVTVGGFGMPSYAIPALFKWFSTGTKLEIPQKFYLGWLNGSPVATSMVRFAEGVAGLYFVAVLPEARRRGIGAAITQKPLAVARDAGYQIGTLLASNMGFPVYLKMGYKEYCKVGSYLWLNHK
jgi:GNAT superfamily N-acetyltransferase